MSGRDSSKFLEGREGESHTHPLCSAVVLTIQVYLFAHPYDRVVFFSLGNSCGAVGERQQEDGRADWNVWRGE